MRPSRGAARRTGRTGSKRPPTPLHDVRDRRLRRLSGHARLRAPIAERATEPVSRRLDAADRGGTRSAKPRCKLRPLRGFGKISPSSLRVPVSRAAASEHGERRRETTEHDALCPLFILRRRDRPQVAVDLAPRARPIASPGRTAVSAWNWRDKPREQARARDGAERRHRCGSIWPPGTALNGASCGRSALGARLAQRNGRISRSRWPAPMLHLNTARMQSSWAFAAAGVRVHFGRMTASTSPDATSPTGFPPNGSPASDRRQRASVEPPSFHPSRCMAMVSWPAASKLGDVEATGTATGRATGTAASVRGSTPASTLSRLAAAALRASASVTNGQEPSPTVVGLPPILSF